MITLKELSEIKERFIENGKKEQKINIVVGLATCGIAAGAKAVYNRLNEEVKARNLKNVDVKIAGCIGMCRLEPLVEVYVPGESKVTYVNVTEDNAAKIVNDHIVNGNIVTEMLVEKD
ncbi:MAG: (2Fe-2S) ferredoxin domain-containing protein [Clostridia bacterium]|nr:(2Fe-2S) ferredoxin domain-containing protein [Clostridia bacterium]